MSAGIASIAWSAELSTLAARFGSAPAEGASDIWEAEAERRVAVLSRHKRPRLWIALEALPRNAQGKVSRREVRERILARYALVDGPHPRLTPLGQR